MLHKNADTITIDLSKLEVKEVTQAGQRHVTIKQGRTPLWKGKRSQLEAAKLAILTKVVEQQAARIEELEQQALGGDSTPASDNSDLLEALSALSAKVDLLEAKMSSAKPTSRTRKKAAKAKEESDDSGTTED